jgi:hypothetical protein
LEEVLLSSALVSGGLYSLDTSSSLYIWYLAREEDNHLLLGPKIYLGFI